MSLGATPVECDACGALASTPDGRPYTLPRGWSRLEVHTEGIARSATLHACSYPCLAGMLCLRGGPAYTERALEVIRG